MSEKEFDAVKMMREIRDNLSEEFKKMNYEEQKRYIRKRILKWLHNNKTQKRS